MLDIVFLCIGAVAGGVIAWFWGQQTMRQKLETEKERRITAEAQLAAVNEIHTQNSQQIKEGFEALASKAVINNSETFLNQSKTLISNLIEPLKDSLNKQENLVKEFENHHSTTIGSLRTYIEELSKSQRSLEKETSSLVTALKAPKVRGRWGEIGLRRIVEFSGMNNYCDFEEQTSVRTENGLLRPDMIVKLPENRRIVVDSKVPLNAYLESIESDNEKTQQEAVIRHTQAVENHVKQLSSKAYWSQFDNTVDFVVLYMEVEPALGLAFSQNKNLVQEAIQNRIVFATPTTLITLLQTVAYTWKQHSATENVHQIFQASKELYERLATFADYLQRIGLTINSVTKLYNQAVGSWEHRIMPLVKKMETFGVNSAKKTINEPQPTETTVRELFSDNVG